MEAAPLNVLVFMGSSKNKGAPWENEEDPRLGSRVLKLVVAWVAKNRPNWSVEVMDPRVLELPVLGAPHFYYKEGEGFLGRCLHRRVARVQSFGSARIE